jgi:hypothetical protein
MPWPPQLPDLKYDLGLDDNRDDVSLATVLTAAIAYVEDARAGDFNFTGTPGSLLPSPGPDIELGTVRLAARWHNRRRSPDGMLDMGELGNARIPTGDPDIERLLGIARFRGPMVG